MSLLGLDILFLAELKPEFHWICNIIQDTVLNEWCLIRKLFKPMKPLQSNFQHFSTNPSNMMILEFEGHSVFRGYVVALSFTCNINWKMCLNRLKIRQKTEKSLTEKFPTQNKKMPNVIFQSHCAFLVLIDGQSKEWGFRNLY